MSSPIRASITTSSANRVSVNNQQRQQIRTVGIAPNVGADELSELTDVDTTGVQNGYTLVYNAATGKFVAQSSMDGGTF